MFGGLQLRLGAGTRPFHRRHLLLQNPRYPLLLRQRRQGISNFSKFLKPDMLNDPRLWLEPGFANSTKSAERNQKPKYIRTNSAMTWPWNDAVKTHRHNLAIARNRAAPSCRQLLDFRRHADGNIANPKQLLFWNATGTDPHRISESFNKSAMSPREGLEVFPGVQKLWHLTCQS